MAEKKSGLYDEFNDNFDGLDELISKPSINKTKKNYKKQSKNPNKVKITEEISDFERLFLKYFPKNLSENGYTLDEKGTLIPRRKFNVTLKNKNLGKGLRKSKA